MTCDDCGMNGELVGHVRRAAKERLGGNCTFADDDVNLMAKLAQRAVLAGLHLDSHGRTRKNMERAAEQTREEHETAIGVKIRRVAAE